MVESNSIFMWIGGLMIGALILCSLFFLLRVLIWDNIRKIFKKKSSYLGKEILEEDPFEW